MPSAAHFLVSRPFIVVADPIAMTRELLKQLFEQEMNALITLLPSASELTTMLHESIPDLVVVEIGTDRVAEVALLAQLRRENPAVPFLVLTAWDLPTDPVDLERSIGADVLISKPFTIDEIQTGVERLLAERSESSESDDALEGLVGQRRLV